MFVSVVIPCFNARRDVGDALDSVFSQTHQELEVVCVDDGSDDGTVDLLNSMRERSPVMMTVVALPRNLGACAARNAGLNMVRGEYVQFLDSDDLLAPEKIAHQLQLMEGVSETVDIIAADYKYRHSEGSEVVRCVERRGPFFGLLASKLGITSANLWRAAALRTVGGFDVALRTSNEYDLMFRLVQNGAKTLVDPTPNTVVRRRGGSLSQAQAGRPDFCERFVHLRLAMLDYVEREGFATPELRAVGYGAILRKIRELWAHDPAAAERLYREAVPADFVPSNNSTGAAYRLLFRYLGFHRAQRVAGMLGRW